MIYSQLFIDYLNSKNPYTLKFFDEAGIKTPDVGTRVYGHAPVGERCIEIIRKCQSPNMTLNVLTSLYDGVGYFNVLDGPTDTVQFLNFFDEMSHKTSSTTGRPVLECGDTIIMYTPIYSPDLNPAEEVFSKVKSALNFDLLPVVNYDLKIAVIEAIDT